MRTFTALPELSSAERPKRTGRINARAHDKLVLPEARRGCCNLSRTTLLPAAGTVACPPRSADSESRTVVASQAHADSDTSPRREWQLLETQWATGAACHCGHVEIQIFCDQLIVATSLKNLDSNDFSHLRCCCRGPNIDRGDIRKKNFNNGM